MDNPGAIDVPSRFLTKGKAVSRRIAVNSFRFIVGSIFMLLGKPFLKRRLTTFVFHEISDTPRAHARETRTFSSRKTFQSQILWIKESFSVRDLKDVGCADEIGGCIVSFDDGYAGVMLNALPMLERANMPFVCFINMATINGEVNSSALAMFVANLESRPVDWRESNPTYYAMALRNMSAANRQAVDVYQGPYLTRDQLVTLSNNSLATIGDHLYNHWLIQELSELEFQSELAKSAQELPNLKSYGAYFASPHGTAPPAALELLQKHAYQSVFSGGDIQFIDGMGVYPRIDLNNEISNRQKFFGTICISMIRNSVRRRRNLRSYLK